MVSHFTQFGEVFKGESKSGPLPSGICSGVTVLLQEGGLWAGRLASCDGAVDTAPVLAEAVTVKSRGRKQVVGMEGPTTYMSVLEATDLLHHGSRPSPCHPTGKRHFFTSTQRACNGMEYCTTRSP